MMTTPAAGLIELEVLRYQQAIDALRDAKRCAPTARAEQLQQASERLRALRDSAADELLRLEEESARQSRFDTRPYRETHGVEPEGVGVWELAPVRPGGKPRLVESVDWAGDVSKLVDGSHPTGLPGGWVVLP
jgi:hypothetical protein